VIRFDWGHIWIVGKGFDVAINYPPFYRRPYAMISVNIKGVCLSLWFGKYWLPRLMKTQQTPRR
jgi:hypothetical protein